MGVVRLMWSVERGLQYEGNHYRVEGIHSGPTPAHNISIWFGVYGPKACRLLGRVADGWIPSLGRSSVEELDARHELIDDAATEAGRDPADIRRLVNIGGSITDSQSEGPLTGPEDQWIDELTSLTLEHGFDSYVFWPEGDPIEQVRRFTDVAEQVRARVEEERS